MNIENDNNCSWINQLEPRTKIKNLSSEIDCDWLIIGAGYTGLSAARKLAQLNPKKKKTHELLELAIEYTIENAANMRRQDLMFSILKAVADKGASVVRVVDLNQLDIVSNIETGDSTKPVFILSTYTTAYVLNGGRVPAIYKDSTMIVIQHKNQLIPGVILKKYS